MMNRGWISRRLSEKRSLAAARGIVGGMAAAILGLTAGTAVAQLPIFVSNQTPPEGYTLHESIDLGECGQYRRQRRHVRHSGQRAVRSAHTGRTYELRALPGTKNTLVDRLKLFTSGLGGDPNDIAKLDLSKGKLYDFSGLFRRDRQYFDYNLLGIPTFRPASRFLSVPPQRRQVPTRGRR